MTQQAEVEIHQVAAVREQEKLLVMAWARDTKTGGLRYILELETHETGAACGCRCISCNHALLAVNAGKPLSKPRPHFRHEPGVETADCQTLSARAALLSTLQDLGWIVLPRRRHETFLIGLSGTRYIGYIEIPAQRVDIDQVRFVDVTTAEVVLTDGRRVLVTVIGGTTLAASDDGPTMVPRIEIRTDDPQLAGLDPKALRELLLPAIECGTWCGHWPDRHLEAAALIDAQQRALDALDWDEIPEPGLPVEHRRESLLHRVVKDILAEAGAITLPRARHLVGGAVVTEEGQPHRHCLRGARLEQRFGNIIPDVLAHVDDIDGADELLIEVTVTNVIRPERLERIRAAGLPALEIDFSRMMGALNLATLRRMVLDELTGKRWLHLPLPVYRPNHSLLYGYEREKNREARRQHMLATAPEQWALSYRNAVAELAYADLVLSPSGSENHTRKLEARESVLIAADALHLHGFPQALDRRLFDSGTITVLHRLISIATGVVVGSKLTTIWQVINSILSQRDERELSWHALYLIAIKVYDPPMEPHQIARCDQWRRIVRASLDAGEMTYRRDTCYDQLFGLLFPEMMLSLDKRKPKRESPSPPPLLIEVDDSHSGSAIFRGDHSQRWRWATKFPDHLRQLEILASKERLNGWIVDQESVLYHLEHSSPYSSPETTVNNVVAALRNVGTEEVWRFLYRRGLILLPS